LSIAPEGIVAEAVDVHGDVVARSQAEARDVATTMTRLARDVARGPIRVAVVSAADPVDRETGRLVELPDAPFLVGALDPRAVLAGLVDGPVTVDNDVNWMARAEGGSDFVYIYLGEGVGCAVVTGGEVLRGHAGLAGEIAHVVTVGPGGRAMRLMEVFAALGLHRAGTTAIDVSAVEAGDDLARAVAGVLPAAVALADPAVILLGGPWARAVLDPVRRQFARAPRHVPVELATVEVEPALAGARETALRQLRDAIVNTREP
jgi:predicted NBD/HSP70 family sugar kinase